MGYKAGTLELEVLGMNDSTAISIERTAKALSSLNRVLGRMKGVSYGSQANKIINMFNKLAVATNSIDAKTMENLAGVAKTLSSISRISKLEKMDFDKVGKGFSNLAVAMTPFVDKVKEAETSLVALDGILKRSTGKKIQGLLGGKKGNGLGGFAKLGISTYMMRRLGRYAASLVKAGSDYYETLNLWQVAMRGNNDLADEFVNKMNKAYGISTQTLMNAQAIFRNMLGSLGQISDETAYQISEALVQMSADFSSLYNVKIEEAFSKMQSMLAGQVRPIRSAGLDMTETTLFMFYQQLGGTKTMRQLNRTEKQLLSILAVYKQMGRAGALGDMSKTLNQWANQTRMMTEYYAELKAWSGLLLKDFLESTGLLVKVNALLITTTEIIKAIAKSRGLGEENFIEGLFETTEATNEEIDELQGKLLDFDKFRSLEDTQASPLAIDEKLLEAISGYSSRISEAENKAENLAETWLKFLGFTRDENGELVITEDKVQSIENLFETIGVYIGTIIGMKFVPWIVGVIKNTNWLTLSMKLLNSAIIGGTVYAILQAIDAFERCDYWAGILYSAIAVGLVGAFVLLHKKAVVSALLSIGKFISTLIVTNVVSRGATLGIIGLSASFIALTASVVGVGLLMSNWSDMNTAQKIAGVCGVIATAVLGVAMAMGAFHSAWSLGLASAGIIAGIVAIAGSIATIRKEAQTPIEFASVGASNLDGGTLFVAGEMGKTEAVYTGSNGKTNVANIQQMKTAYSQALNEFWRSAKNDIPQFQGVSDSGIYTIVDGEAKRRGKTFSNVR